MPTGDRNDPYSAFNFLIQFDGETVAGFSECSGLTTETDIVEYRNGDEDITVRKLPGLKKFTNISLKRGMTKTSLALWTWFDRVMQKGQHGLRASGRVTMLAEDGDTPRLNFVLERCLPVKLKAPALNAKEGAVAIEEMQIAYERMKITRPKSQNQQS